MKTTFLSLIFSIIFLVIFGMYADSLIIYVS